MTSITLHTGASMPLQNPPGAAGSVPAGPSHPPPSTYTTQTLPIAVPLPDFWHQQRPSPSAHQRQCLQHPQSHYQYATASHHFAPPPSAANPESSHHAWPGDERSHQQHETRPSSSSNIHNQSLNAASPHVSHSQHHQPAYVYAVPAPSYAPSSTDNTTLPLHQQYSAASSSSSSVQDPQSNHNNRSSFTSQRPGKENIAPESPKPSKDLQSQKESENVNQKIIEDRSETPNADTPNEFSEAELTARFSSVSQIEAQPTLDPETGEAVYPCPFCDKHYGGKHARSIWRRHLSNKHGIPLNLQPRRTRWDNDVNRPKDEAERHKRTLESKRRWAAKNRAEKRAKRKGTTVEEELGLIEAAEAAAAAKPGGANHEDDENGLGDESFTSQDGSLSVQSGAQLPPSHAPQAIYQIQHHPRRQYWQQVRQGEYQPLSVQVPGPVYQVMPPENRPSQHAQAPLDPSQSTHVRYVSYPPPSSSVYEYPPYVQGDAGHQPYTVIYPAYSISSDSNAQAHLQRSPLQPEYQPHVRQDSTPFTASVSPLDGSFEHQQAQYMQAVYQIAPNHQHPVEAGSSARLLHTAPLAQQPFLAPPRAAPSAASMHRSVSAPIVVANDRVDRSQQAGAAPTEAVPHAGTPVTYVQYVEAQGYAVQSETPLPEATETSGPPVSHSNSANGMTIYIPPHSQPIQGWPQSQQATPIAAHPTQQTYAVQQQFANGQQQPPTPYFYLSVPQSTPAAEHQTRATPTSQTAQSSASEQTVTPVPAAQPDVVEQQASVSRISAQKEEAPAAQAVYEGPSKPSRRKQGGKKLASSKTNKKKSSTNSKAIPPSSSSILPAHSAKTYQEAAMQLLALKTSSSSPPASPAKELSEDEIEDDMWRSMDRKGSAVADVEDSGYLAYDDLPSAAKRKATVAEHQARIDEEADEDEAEQERRTLRFASIPPSSPAPRMSLSPDSSPLPVVPSKLSATYLRSQASSGQRSTPIGMKRKLVRKMTDNGENDENSERHEEHVDEEEEDGERISLDSSPERDDEEMAAPIAKRRMLAMSSASPRSRHRGREATASTSMAGSTSRSPSPSRYHSTASSFATSVMMSTPQLVSQSTHSNAPDGLFFSHSNHGALEEAGGREDNEPTKNRITNHRHRSSIFKIDNCSRPSAGLGGIASSSSPSRPFLLSSPEHAAVSKSLGLVPDNFTNTSLSLPSDSEGFEMHFLSGFSRRGMGNGNTGGGLSEYAKDVFGGPLGG